MAFGSIKADKVITSAGEVDLTNVIPGEATQSEAGLMSAGDKTKLDGVEAGAQVNAVTSVNGQTGAVTVDGFSGDYDDLTNKPAIPSATSDLTNDANYITAAEAPVQVADLPAVGDGTISFQSFGENAAADSNFHTNQVLNQTITLPQIRYSDLSSTPDLSTKADLVGGKLNTSQLPDLAVAEYLGDVADETARLTLDGQEGDWVIQNDDGKVYVITGDTPSQSASWTALSYPTGFSGAYADLSGKPTLGTAAATDATAYATSAQGTTADSAVQPGDLATVATSGSFNDLSDKPAAFDPSTLATVATTGSYSDLSGKPSLFDGDYDSLSNKPALATVATSGAYSDLSGTPEAGSVTWTPTLPQSGGGGTLTQSARASWDANTITVQASFYSTGSQINVNQSTTVNGVADVPVGRRLVLPSSVPGTIFKRALGTVWQVEINSSYDTTPYPGTPKMCIMMDSEIVAGEIEVWLPGNYFEGEEGPSEILLTVTGVRAT